MQTGLCKEFLKLMFWVLTKDGVVTGDIQNVNFEISL